MSSWQQKLKDRIKYLEEENFKLNQQIAFVNRENKILIDVQRSATVMTIALEKTTEAMTQLVCSATTIMQRAGR
jgi:hypothetical protein